MNSRGLNLTLTIEREQTDAAVRACLRGGTWWYFDVGIRMYLLTHVDLCHTQGLAMCVESEAGSPFDSVIEDHYFIVELEMG